MWVAFLWVPRPCPFSRERKFPFAAMQLLTSGAIFASVTTRGGQMQVVQLSPQPACGEAHMPGNRAWAASSVGRATPF